MSISFTIEETFRAPPEEIFAVIADLDSTPHWMPTARMDRLAAGPFGPGTRFRETRTIHGRVATEIYEVTGWDPPHALEFVIDGKEGSSGRGAYRFKYTFAPEAAGTRLTLQSEVTGMGFLSNLLGPLLARPFRKAVVEDHLALKAYVER